jgi:uncharacterized tellurite resistance protein B-like protein
MQKFIELMLLAAAADGQISTAERDIILDVVSRNRKMQALTVEQLGHVQNLLLEKYRGGATAEAIVEAAALAFTSEVKLMAYALCVEVVLADTRLLPNEAEFLKLLRAAFQLPKGKVDSIHLSAQLRLGIDNLS